jgi:putative hemolysin
MNVPHSFFPVAEGTLDKLVGVISAKDLCIIKGSDGDKNIQEYIKPALRVSATKDALSVLEEFKRERRHMAIVLDQYGGVSGVVTTHDLLEALVGDLADFEGEGHSIVKRPDGSYLVDASIDIQEVLFRLDRSIVNDEETSEFHSVGGILFREMNNLPKVGQKIIWKGLALEVVDMDGYRIDKVLVSISPESSDRAQSSTISKDKRIGKSIFP